MKAPTESVDYDAMAAGVAETWKNYGDDGERYSYARTYLSICEKQLTRRLNALGKRNDPHFWLFNKTAFFVSMAYAGAYKGNGYFTKLEEEHVDDAEHIARNWLKQDGASELNVQRWRDVAWAYQEDNSEALALLLRERRPSRRVH